MLKFYYIYFIINKLYLYYLLLRFVYVLVALLFIIKKYFYINLHLIRNNLII